MTPRQTEQERKAYHTLMRELGAGDEADAQRTLLNEAFGEEKA